MRCKDCKHWQEGGDPDQGPTMNNRLIGAGICQRIKLFSDSGEWTQVESDEVSEMGVELYHKIRISDATGTKAWAQDADEYMAGVITTPDFGCVMFETKE